MEQMVLLNEMVKTSQQALINKWTREKMNQTSCISYVLHLFQKLPFSNFSKSTDKPNRAWHLYFPYKKDSIWEHGVRQVAGWLTLDTFSPHAFELGSRKLLLYLLLRCRFFREDNCCLFRGT